MGCRKGQYKTVLGRRNHEIGKKISEKREIDSVVVSQYGSRGLVAEDKLNGSMKTETLS